MASVVNLNIERGKRILKSALRMKPEKMVVGHVDGAMTCEFLAAISERDMPKPTSF
jgi:hypothetical protein